MSGNAERFYGWRVARGAFLLAVFGWGLGFYGPPVFLGVIHATRGWPLSWISAAVSTHFLLGALVGANLPRLHRRFGAAPATQAGMLAMALGLPGWALSAEPWQLFLAAGLSGAGWGTMSASALNAIVSPWFVRARPAALGMAYNGGSVGGMIFSPLWVAAITVLGFPGAASAMALVMLVTLWPLAACVFTRTPDGLGVRPDGDAHDAPIAVVTSPAARPLPGAMLWRDCRFITLVGGMTLGLFVQIGLVAHLFSLLLPALGAHHAGWAMGFMTLMAICGRWLLGRLMPMRVDRRLVACCGYAMQMGGVAAWLLADGVSVPLIVVGVTLFGLGFGNATSLPPLIAQVEFVPADVPRVVALMVGIAQGGYAIAPAFFGVIREFGPTPSPLALGAAPAVFVAAILLHCLAIAVFLAGRRPSQGTGLTNVARRPGVQRKR